MENLIVVIVAVGLNISGAILCKYISTTSGVVTLLVLLTVLAVVYAGRVVFWIVAGKKYQLSYLYPILSMNYLFAFLLGMVLFQEAFSPQRLIGAAIIVGGVVVVSLTGAKEVGTES